jgi:predicted amidohydrolase
MHLVIKLRTNKKIFLLLFFSFFLLPCVFGAQVNAPVAAFSDAIWVEEKYSTAQETIDAASSWSIEVDETVARSFQENLTGTIQGGHQMLQFSSVSNSASFSRHIMCKDHDIDYNPIDPTTIFRPSDIKAECLTTVSINDTIEFRWYYRSNSSKTWVSCYNWSAPSLIAGEYHYVGYLLIAGYWPGSHYPRAYKVDVYLDSSLSFSEFFEVTNGGLNSPRICEDVDVNGHPVNVKSRFTIGADTKAHHYLRFDKIAYFNEELSYCHNFTTVWIQPNGNTYKTYSSSFNDYKDTNVTWNYWKYGKYAPDDYISINSSTPVGNWKIEVYLDRYYFNNTWMRYGPIATTPFIVGSEPVADWTFIVYLDADNTLENASIKIFEKIASVGSSSQVNIVIQMDRHPDQDIGPGNWTDCKRFNVTKGMTPTSENSIDDLGEANMGDSSTLKDFVNWTIHYYPANYYFLVLWDHGTGCMGLCFDVTNASDFLSLPELSQALSGLPAIMDVVLLDACSMSMTEVAYQIRDYANILVGPEGIGYAPAPYDEYISSLTNNPSISPSAFATEVVTDYIDWCFDVGEDVQNATMSATDLTEITSLTATIDDFALNLRENESFYNYLINLARNLTAGYQGPVEEQSGYYIDLYHFAQLTNQYVLDEELRNAADQVMTTLESIIIIEADKRRQNSHGLSIFFPDEEKKYDAYKILYEGTTFAEDTLWDEFVKYYLHIQTYGYVLTIKTPYPDIFVRIDEESYTTDAEGKIRVYILPNSHIVTIPTLVLTEPGSRGVFTQWNDYETNSSRTITVTDPTTYTAYYETQYEVTFGQSGVGTDFTGTVVTVDETGYNATNLPVSFWWVNATPHTFAFQSPLVVTHYAKQYVWNSTTGLSPLQSDPITVSTSGNIIGNYKTKFYLTLVTSPSGVTTPSGEGWYYNGTDASIFTGEFVDITPGASRYLFNVWTTTDMTGISDQNSSSTAVRMDKAKTVTANYITQYYLTVTSLYGSPTPEIGWFEAGKPVTSSVTSPVSGPAGTRYVCTRWIGTGSVPTSGTNTSVTFTIGEPSSITWNWETQYFLVVSTDPKELSPQPSVSSPGPWYCNGTLVTCTAQKISEYVFYQWTVDGESRDAGINPIAVTMDGPYEATAHYVERAPSSIPPLTLSLNKIEKGETITVSGVVMPAHEGVPVTLTYKRPDGSTLNRTVISSSGGKFSDTYEPDAAGTWNVTASWLGDADDYGATSTAVSFAVKTRAWWETLSRPEMLQVILGLVAIVLAVAFVGTVWVRTRRSARARTATEEWAAVAEKMAAKKKYELVYRDLLKEYPRIQRRECRVAIAQIGVSKTGDIIGEFYEEEAAGFFRLRKDKVETVRSKVKNMIEIAHAKGVNILLFPELIVDLNYSQLLEDVANLAKAYEMYIIPGSYHDEQTKRNLSLVVGLDGVLWEQEKHIPAAFHHKDKRIREGIEVGTIPRKTIVCNTEFGRITVAICRDFLDMDLRVELKNFEPPVDIIFNPAFTPVTEDFKAAHFDARRSIYAYCFFANAAEFGDSFIYTPEKERVERRVPPGEESLIYKDIDLFKLRSERKKWEKEQKKERRFIQSTR